MTHGGCGLFGFHGDQMRLFDGTACGTISDIRAREFERSSVVGAPLAA